MKNTCDNILYKKTNYRKICRIDKKIIVNIIL